MNYEDILNSLSSSVAKEDIRELIDKNIYNINFSSESISFELDFQNLSKELYGQNINFNLILLNCSLNKKFFTLNGNSECPQFKQKTINKKKYLYLFYKKLSYRLGEYDSSKDLREVWYNFLFIKNNIFKTLLAPNKYLATKNYLGYSPKIISYNSGKLEIEIEGFYNEKQFHFLINFF